MTSNIADMFDDEGLIKRIKEKLPYLFQLAELDSSRDGKVGMEVGSLREKILVALLIYKFGEENVETEIPITESETDVKVYNRPISIKTFTKKNLIGFKVSWTVDARKAREFREDYLPACDLILVHINWEGMRGGFYFIPVEAQKEILKSLGAERYLKLPKEGTNPRGIETTKEAVLRLVNHPLSRGIEIDWQKREIEYNPYEKWVELWESD